MKSQGKAMIVGYAKFGEPIDISDPKKFDQYRKQTLIEKGDDFDLKPGQKRYGYPVEDAVEIDPIPLPEGTRNNPRNRFFGEKEDSAIENSENKKAEGSKTSTILNETNRDDRQINGTVRQITNDLPGALRTLGLSVSIDEIDDNVKEKLVFLSYAYTSAKTGNVIYGMNHAVEPRNLVSSLHNLGVISINPGTGSGYTKVGDDQTLRIAYHEANTYNFKTSGDNVSIVVENARKGRNKFSSSERNVVEIRFNGRELASNKDKFCRLISDIASFIATGEYHNTTGDANYGYSGSDNFKRAMKAIERADAKNRSIKFSSDIGYESASDMNRRINELSDKTIRSIVSERQQASKSSVMLADYDSPSIIGKKYARQAVSSKAKFSHDLYLNPAEKQRFSVGKSGNTGTLLTDKTTGQPLKMSSRAVLEQLLQRSKLDTSINAAEIKSGLKTLDSLADFVKKAELEFTFIGMQHINSAKLVISPRDGSIVLSALVKNGEYPVNFDLTKVCSRRLAMTEFIEELSHRPGNTPKSTELFTPYNNEIELMAPNVGDQTLQEYLFSIGGLRSQSFSDFIITHVFDVVQKTVGTASRGLPAQCYTKMLRELRS